MRTGFPRAGGRQRRDLSSSEVRQAPAPSLEDLEDEGSRDGGRIPSGWLRRAYLLLGAVAWLGGSLLVFEAFWRVSGSALVDSDGANSALQGWALIHGHLLLHGWLIGDATFYFFELPLLGITQLVLGMGNYALHVASALVYSLVAISAAALAVTGSRGAARVVRCALIVIILAVPLLSIPGLRLVVEEPDHIGTTVFILVSFLLIERAPERRFTPPLLCVILFAGQFGDVTVRYIAVPAVVLACGYRALAQRRLRSADGALVAAAVASVPLALIARAVMVHLGGYWAPPPRAELVGPAAWPHHAVKTWHNLRVLYSATPSHDARLGQLGMAVGMACLLVSAAAAVWVACTWLRRSRAEQMLVVLIALNIAAYMVTVLASTRNGHEFMAVLPCSAVLAARVFVPARIGNAFVGVIAVVATTVSAVLLLQPATTRPLDKPNGTQLIPWLEAHNLDYGLGGYWNAANITVQSGGKVHVLAVDFDREYGVSRPGYEMNLDDYNAATHDARFVITNLRRKYKISSFKQTFGPPVATYNVGIWTVLVYDKNLLAELTTSTASVSYTP